MSNYQQNEEMIKDFSLRTFRNLKIICDHKSVYEVTHLLNSCLGLLVFPEDKYFDTLWKDEPNMSFPNSQIASVAGTVTSCHQILDDNPCRCSSHYGHMLRHLRNAFAHCEFTTFPENEGEIKKILFIDKKPKSDIVVVEYELTIEDLYNVAMSVLYLTLRKKKFPLEEAKKCAEHLKVKLDIYGIS